MAVAKKAKITFTCEPSLREGLEAWAEKESRTLSNLVELVIRQAYEAHQELEPEPEPTTKTAAAKTQPTATTKRSKS
ncbi:MAG: hypothetical protein M3N42_00035 [Cyanobacteriota bacterium]|nr:hypothetical protein [Cyanobacteriota bacterium]